MAAHHRPKHYNPDKKSATLRDFVDGEGHGPLGIRNGERHSAARAFDTLSA
jgi:hypothetical protein